MTSDPSKLSDKTQARARRLKVIEAVAVMGMTAAEAASYAGVSEGGVRKMLADERVKKHIADMQQAASARLQVTREDVTRGILQAIEDARMLGEPASQIRGWEAIAKMQGYNAPERHIHEIPEDTREYIEMLRTASDSDLMRLTGARGLIELTEEDYKRVN